MDEESFLGTVTRFDAETLVAKIALQGKLYVGDTILIRKGGIRVIHKVESMRIQGINVDTGFIGDIIELEMKQQVAVESDVYKVPK